MRVWIRCRHYSDLKILCTFKLHSGFSPCSINRNYVLWGFPHYFSYISADFIFSSTNMSEWHQELFLYYFEQRRKKNFACLFEPSNNNKKKIPSHWPKLDYPQVETHVCWWLQSTTYTCFYLMSTWNQRHKICFLRQTYFY